MLYHVVNPERVQRVRVAKEVETVNPDGGKQKPFVRKAKKELIDSLPDNGVAILNGDDPFVINTALNIVNTNAWM